jgi:hypothetical protein
MSKEINPKYLAMLALLSELEREHLMSRMMGKYPRRRVRDRVDNEISLALQLELEDEQLRVWREMMSKIREKENAKLQAHQAKEVKKNAKKVLGVSKQKINIEDIAPAAEKKSGKKKVKKS